MTIATGPSFITDNYQEEKKDSSTCFMPEPHNEKKRKLVESQVEDKRDKEALSGK